MGGLQLDQSVEWEELINRTKGYSGADIANVCREAALMPMRRKILGGGVNILELPKMQEEINVPLTMDDFSDALKNIMRSVSNDHLEKYEQWMKEFGAV